MTKKYISQDKHDAFNIQYLKAVYSSDPEEYFKAALLARQLIDSLECAKVLDPCSYNRAKDTIGGE